MIETHKIYIDYVITKILASSDYISNPLVSTLVTSIIHINFNGEHPSVGSTIENLTILVHRTPSR
jgi:hypothetical protein